jgi:hypothetical protein
MSRVNLQDPLNRIQTLSESGMFLLQFNVRWEARVQHPGLCTEEYQRMTELVIKYVFNWATETQRSNGMGLFGLVLA